MPYSWFAHFKDSDLGSRVLSRSNGLVTPTSPLSKKFGSKKEVERFLSKLEDGLLFEPRIHMLDPIFPTMKEIHLAFARANKIEPTTIEEDFTHNCYAVSCTLATMLGKIGIPARAVYGQWHGLSVLTPGLSFHQHGWVQTNTQIIDPTRFAFEGEPAYLYECDLDNEEYDEGARRLKANFQKPFPKDSRERIKTFAWTPATEEFLREATGVSDVRNLSMPQALWVANLDFKRMGDHIHEVYAALRSAGYGAFIPLDYAEYEKHKRA